MVCNHTGTNLDLCFFTPLQLCFIPYYSSRWHSLQETVIQLIRDHSPPLQAHTTCLLLCTHLNTYSPALITFEDTAAVTLYLSVESHHHVSRICLWPHTRKHNCHHLLLNTWNTDGLNFKATYSCHQERFELHFNTAAPMFGTERIFQM